MKVEREQYSNRAYLGLICFWLLSMKIILALKHNVEEIKLH